MQSTKDVMTFTAGEALEAYRLVKLTGDKTVSYADAGEYEDAIGITCEKVASGAQVGVIDKKCGGTVEVEASAAITQNDDIIAAADGRVAPDGGTTTELTIGQAVKAASGAGSVIECYLRPTVVSQNLS